MTSENEWEYYGKALIRIKVDGGYIYSKEQGMCFVPDVDLQRYQAHLRDAYTQGYKAGQEDAKHGVTQDLNASG